MKVSLVVCLAFVVCVVALDELDTGDGICSLCVQNKGVSDCCSGNVLCNSLHGSLDCTQTTAMRDDYPKARGEFASALYDMGNNNFCSICCGRSTESTTCCSAKSSCTCTKTLLPSCTD
uniref:Uncharacterized LOC100178605 n=1 Tax=Ciona intestinalis TaxID=7719 RepID=F6VFS6_CIOIN|nr:uncharacterized protein LOC100178605 [Ciona intestinalis]|eukprot:XP_002127425.1 uncharacterized protein LOC100178605 [Ciona intestinalis]